MFFNHETKFAGRKGKAIFTNFHEYNSVISLCSVIENIREDSCPFVVLKNKSISIIRG